MCSLDNIVTLGVCPDESASESGFTLMMAKGITLKNLANIATETYNAGLEMAMSNKSLTITQFKNDFIGALQLNKVVTTISNPQYDTGIFNTSENIGTYAGYRGLNIYKSHKYKGRLRKTYIKSIQVYPLASGDTVINIWDGINSYSYAVTLVANQINTFDEDNLEGFPFVMASTDSGLRITIDQTSIPLASSKITCLKGCNGTVPNECAWADGWDGERNVKSEGYGLNVQFYCGCDYEQVICDLSKTFTGELIWLKWQYNILEEQLYSNRFTNMVVYNKEQTEKRLKELEADYTNKWNALMAGLLSILQTYKDDCLDCRGIRWRTNL